MCFASAFPDLPMLFVLFWDKFRAQERPGQDTASPHCMNQGTNQPFWLRTRSNLACTKISRMGLTKNRGFSVVLEDIAVKP